MELWAGEHHPSLAASGSTKLLLNYMLCTEVVLHLMEFTSMTRTTNMIDLLQLFRVGTVYFKTLPSV